MNELLAFLRAQLTADEQAALGAMPRNSVPPPTKPNTPARYRARLDGY
ncbi:hypothetical protein [Actinomadura sp. 3N508]